MKPRFPELWAVFTFFLANFPLSELLAQGPTLPKSDSLLIHDVHFLSLTDTSGVRVSLLIVDGRLELVTSDDIQSAPGTTVYDGRSGFLMGRVNIGQPPSFVVLSENPRENFDIFLNTRDYVIFAMEDGKVVSNQLPQIRIISEEESRRRLTWTAYTPPTHGGSVQLLLQLEVE